MSGDVVQPDVSAIRNQLGNFARLVGDIPCRLVLGGFGQNIDTGAKLDPVALSFVPADAGKMVDRVMAIDAEPHRNIYLSTAIFRQDLEAGKKGGEADVVGVLAIVQDFDAKDMGDAAKEWPIRCPDGATMVLQTSGLPKPSFQVFYIFKRPVPLDRAKAIAAALDRKTGADSCSKDMSHVWRIAGTRNKPKPSKIAEGRPREPQAVQVCVPFDESRLWDLEDLERAVGQRPDLAPASSPTRVKPGKDATKVRIDRATVRPVTPDDLRTLGLPDDDIDKASRVYADPKIKEAYPSRSEHLFGVTCAMVRAKMPPEIIYSVITDKAWGVSESVREKGHAYAERQVQRSTEKVTKEDRPGGKSGPTGRELARLVQASYGAPLIFHQAEWYEYRDGLYLPVEATAIRKAVYEGAEAIDIEVNSKTVSDAVDGLETLCLIRRDRLAPPCWMDSRAEPHATEIVAFANGLLHLPTKTLYPHEPAFITFNALPYGYDPAAQCPRWMRYLGELWPTEQDCIDVLQEFMGYLLTGDTSLQKILCVIGAKRSGKGTLARVMRKLIGEQNVASPKLQSFGENFGRQCLINKRLAILADVRIGPRTDVSSAATTLLEISGEDPQEIPRKNKLDWSGHSEVRFVLISNLPPSITDPSGVLPTRYLMLPMRQSFFGKEDIDLTTKLVAELPGVLNWAIEGRERLYRNGRFTVLTSGSDLVEQTHRVSSGIQAFIDDACDFGDDLFVSKDGLYFAYLTWFAEQGIHDHNKLSKEMFGMNFTGATMGLGVRGDNQTKKGLDQRDKERRVPVWRGVQRRDGRDLSDYSDVRRPADSKGMF